MSTEQQAAPPQDQGLPSGKKKPKQQESTRDTIESILFAFVLAFLFRTFEAEAFVIPTGSMAPTLYGRHKESTCTQCGHEIVVGASHEVDSRSGYLTRGVRVRSAVCSNCGFNNQQLLEELAFNGDRILVNKFPYEFGEPDRWDVFVFKYPEEPETNYIKRLVGLPGETIQIRGGDLFRQNGEAFEILRKNPEKQRRLQIPVYDDVQAPRALLDAGWPERWAAVEKTGQGGVAGWAPAAVGWRANADARDYQLTAADAQDWRWLRYRHFFAMPSDWDTALAGRPVSPRPRLIGDLCGYNATVERQFFDVSQVDYGPYWCRDLTLNCHVRVEDVQANGELQFELCEGASWYRVRFQLADGAVTLEEVNSQMNERVKELGVAQGGPRGAGRYRVSFANVDDRLCVWVNERLLDFGEGAMLSQPGPALAPFPTEQDLSPVGIAGRGVTVTVSQLLIERDIYYRAAFAEQQMNDSVSQFQRLLNQTMTDPERWGDLYHQHAEQQDQRTLTAPEGHFLALGDNSPQSKDSRMWMPGLEAVPRAYLVGKAFWIYWPHGVPFLNNGRGYTVVSQYEHTHEGLKRVPNYPRYTAPFYPQFWRMNRIR